VPLNKCSMPDSFKPLIVLVLPALLCACGSAAPSGAGKISSHAQHVASNKPSPKGQDTVDPDLVSAVSPGGSGPPIGLKFRLDTRPVVGMPAQLVLALIPTPGVEITHIHGSLQVADGLQLQSAHSFDIEAPQPGAPLRQDVTVVPQRNGVLSISATLVIDYNDGSVARTYSIPLIAANNAS
jgi:hypothetical protein